MNTRKQNIVVYDDLCILCTWSIKFIISNDPNGLFYFSSLSDPEIKTYLNKYGDNNELCGESVILINDSGIFYYSNAAIKIVGQLDSKLSVLKYLRFVPVFIRDAVYRLVAKYRYKIWGKRITCWLAPEKEKYRFDYQAVLQKIKSNNYL